MSNKQLSAAFAYQVPPRPADGGEAPPAASAIKFVLVALADHADERGVCWPGVWRLTMFTQLSERTVQRCLQELVRLGVVKIRAYPKGGRRRATEYVVAVPVAGESTDDPHNPRNPVSLAGNDGENPVTLTPYRGEKGAAGTGKGVRLTQNPVGLTHQPPEPPENQRQGPASAGPAPAGGPYPDRSRPAAGLAAGGGSDVTAARSRPANSSADAHDSNGPLRARGANLAPLIAAIVSGTESNGTTAGYANQDLEREFAKLDSTRKHQLAVWAQVQESQRMPLEQIRRGVAIAVMRGVNNPFAYFAAGQPARRQLEAE